MIDQYFIFFCKEQSLNLLSVKCSAPGAFFFNVLFVVRIYSVTIKSGTQQLLIRK
jgi:hypothetical protein